MIVDFYKVRGYISLGFRLSGIGDVMTANLSELVREARRRKGLTQAQVAEAIDCKQSAVSMFENGRRDALSRDKLVSLGKLLDVDPSRAAQESDAPTGNLRYCPDVNCPSNVPFMVGGRVAIRPSMTPVSGSAPSYCRYCGEVMAASCSNAECKESPEPGAFCAACGTAYISTATIAAPSAEWVRSRQEASRNLIELANAIEGNQTIKGVSQ